MRIPLFIAVGTTALMLAGSATAQNRELELRQDSGVRFECYGPRVTRPAAGRFSAVAGRMTIDPRDLSTATAELRVVMRSITTDHSGWDEMFRAAGFLELMVHPTSTFELTEIRGANALQPGAWTRVLLAGRFMVHGQTRNVVARARIRWTPSSADAPERVEVFARFRFRFRDHEIWIPRGNTETFAGEGAEARVRLRFEGG